MEELKSIARCPSASISPDATARQAADLLIAERVGAAVVLEGGKLLGILSERDLVSRVLGARRDPDGTRVSEIMTRDVRTARAGMNLRDALEVMHAGNFRHLPLVDEAGLVVGMLSIRHLLRWRVIELGARNTDLLGFISADGPGG
jgi:CBS domain-containing protein